MRDKAPDRTLSAAPEETLLPREFVEGLSECFVQFDADWSCLDCNRAALRFLRRPRARIIGRTLWSFPQISQNSPFGALCRRVRASGRSEEAEAEFPHRGRRRLLLVQVFRLGDGVGAVWRDITEARAAERRLAESELYFRTLADDMPAAAWASSPDGALTFINQAMVDTLGRERQELLGEGWWRAVDEADRDRLTESLRLARETASPFDYEGRFRHADGSLRVIHLHGRPRFDGDAFAGHVGMAQDLTERRGFERRQVLLIGELNHRIKNTLATVQSMVTQTLRQADPEREEALNARLMALSAAHNVLTKGAWEGAYLRDIITTAVLPYADTRRLDLSGPPVWISTGATVALSMALHELATNAVKYGALSVPDGRVQVHWTCDDAGVSDVEWRELGGPPVAAPTRSGFGSRLLGRGLAGELGAPADLDFKPDGLVARFRVHAQPADAPGREATSAAAPALLQNVRATIAGP